MIITLLDNKSHTATGATNYCLGVIDGNHNRRSIDPVILNGDEFLTRSIDRTHCQKLSNKAISGVIAFRDNENITDEQKKELISDFKDTFLGNMRGRVNCLFIEHRDKGNLEIHFIINRVDLKTGYHYNPFPPKKYYELKDTFENIKNQEYGFDQISHKKNKTLDLNLSSNEKKALSNPTNGFKNLATKIELDKHLQELVKDGDIKNRNDLLKYLHKAGLEVTRKGDDYITIKTNDDKSIRFKGGIYEKNNGNDYDLNIQKIEHKPVKTYEENIKRLSELVDKRNEFNCERYKVKSQQVRPLKMRLGVKEPMATVKPDVMTRMEALRTASTGMPMPTHADTSPALSSGFSGGSGGGDIDGQINAATSDLTNAKTDIERANAKARLQALLAQKERMKMKI